MFVALVVLTLISCCFLGSTFARYTSEGTGSATVEVANWKIDVIGGGTEGATEVSFTQQLSPDYDTPFSGDTNRTNTTAKLLIAEIKNNGEVDASLTVSAAALTYEGTTLCAGITSVDSEEAASQEQFNQVFSIQLYQYVGASSTPDSAETIDGAIALGVGQTVYIYATITWTTLDQVHGEAVADAVDTWFGENLTAIAIEKHHATTSQITIYGGAFRSTGSSGGYDGIWYGNTSVELTIYGGTFTGSARNGLYFDGDPGANVQIDGGTFIGAGNQRAFGGTSLSFNSILTAGRYAYGADSIATEGANRIERTVWTGGSGANYRRIDVK